MASMSNSELIRALQQVAGEENVLTSSKQTRYYRTGFRSGEGSAVAVVFPSSLWVQWQVLQACVNAGAIIIMQAANTGLTEGSSPSGHDYDRPVVIISGKKLDKLVLLNEGSQVLAFPGTSLYQLENALKPLKREPHSVIGSSCIGASVVGGIANNSGGALVQRGPAYTELSLYAQVNEQGELTLVNHLGLELGDSPQEILQRLEALPAESNAPATDKMASDREYIARVRDVNAETPARYNADPRRQFESSGCAGKLAVFAVRLDTFVAEEQSQVFYLGTNDAAVFTEIRRHIHSSFEHMPVLGEYIHKTAFDVARDYGKDTFIAIKRLGTDAMPRLFSVKGYFTSVLNSVPLMPRDLPDRMLQWASKLFPQHLPNRLLQFHARYEHHLIIKMSGDGIAELNRYLASLFGNESEHERADKSHASTNGAYIACTPDEATDAMLHRFAVAGAGVRYLQVNTEEVEDIVALDIALKRNESNWFEALPSEISEKILPPLYYGHFFCHVFHQDYLVKKGYCAKDVKKALLAYQDTRQAAYPAEHNFGHLYQVPPETEAFYRSLDPTNTFNSGIGKTSKQKRYGGCC
ncbi:D-lactate dehydrogenase [Teredinibacter turnerae]|uniref:D-lactate dehydrogenase n=1 Tax=Teredinibacter turnerae TaxID=2426 RepID=UPI000362CB4B